MNVGELRSTLMDEDGKLSETMKATLKSEDERA